MHGKYHQNIRKPSRQLQQGGTDLLLWRPLIFAAMGGDKDHSKLLFLDPIERGVSERVFPAQNLVEGINNRVACNPNSFSGNSFGQKVLPCFLGWSEMCVGEDAGQVAIYFFRKGVEFLPGA